MQENQTSQAVVDSKAAVAEQPASDTVLSPAAGSEKQIKKPKKRGKKRGWRRFIKPAVIVLIIAAIVGGIWWWIESAKSTLGSLMSNINTETVQRGDLDVKITSSGVMEAMDKYDIVPMVMGKITSAPFEEGDTVSEGTLLFTFDSSDAQINIQKAQNSISKAEISQKSDYETMEDWVTYATAEGTVSGMNLKVGDTISANSKICTVTNNNSYRVLIPFTASQVNSIFEGQSAQLTSPDYMTSNIFGTVTDIDNTPIRSGDGSILYNVEITLDDPGSISPSMSLTATINGMLCAGAGTVETFEAEDIMAKGSGTITAIYINDGDYITEGQKVLEITNESVLDNIEKSQIDYDDLQLSLQSQYDQLEDYTITSPISGTVIAKNYKTGDTVGNSANSVVMATIADMSKMKFTMDIDELDISKIQIGQQVEVVADALTDQTFTGQITQIMQEGTSQNGVTTYPVEVVIDQPGALMIGMNVTATVITDSRTDVLKVPVDAVTMQDGKSYVRVLSDEAKARVQAAQSPKPSGAGSAEPQAGLPGGSPYTEEDFVRTEVTTGVSNEDEIEILSGVSEGDIVYVTVADSGSSLQAMMMGGMGGPPAGGGEGGGAPAGDAPAGGPGTR